MTARLREARPEDAHRLFDWLNAPDSLAGKRKTAAPISWPEHETWFRHRLDDPATRLWLIEYAGEPVGQIRLSPDDAGRRVVDIYLLPAERGRGLAQAALAEALRRAAALWPGEPVHAEVKAQNTASHRLFCKAGFSVEAVAPTHTLYRFYGGSP